MITGWLVQVGLVHVGLVQVGLVHVGLVHVGLVQVGLVHVGLVQVGLVQVGLVQVGLTQVGFSRLAAKDGSVSTVPDAISGDGYVTLFATPAEVWTGRIVNSASWLSSTSVCTGARGSGAMMARLLFPPAMSGHADDDC